MRPGRGARLCVEMESDGLNGSGAHACRDGRVIRARAAPGRGRSGGKRREWAVDLHGSRWGIPKSGFKDGRTKRPEQEAASELQHTPGRKRYDVRASRSRDHGQDGRNQAGFWANHIESRNRVLARPLRPFHRRLTGQAASLPRPRTDRDVEGRCDLAHHSGEVRRKRKTVAPNAKERTEVSSNPCAWSASVAWRIRRSALRRSQPAQATKCKNNLRAKQTLSNTMRVNFVRVHPQRGKPVYGERRHASATIGHALA